MFDAREKFEEALQIEPDNTLAKFALIECKIKQNKPKEAIAELEPYREEYGSKKEFKMLHLLAYLKMDEMENNEYLVSQILEVCDNILSNHGEDAWVEKIKEDYIRKQNNKDSEG